MVFGICVTAFFENPVGINIDGEVGGELRHGERVVGDFNGIAIDHCEKSAVRVIVA